MIYVCPPILTIPAIPNNKTASAVSRLDNLEFLVDIVPRTVPYKQVKEKKAPQGVTLPNGEGGMETGQTTLDVRPSVLNGSTGTNGLGGHDGAGDHDTEAADPNVQLEMEIRGAIGHARGALPVNGQSSQDVEMSGFGS